VRLAEEWLVCKDLQWKDFFFFLHRNGHYQGTNFKGTATADETQVYKRSAVILQEKQGTRKHASNRKEIYKQASGKQQLKPLTKV